MTNKAIIKLKEYKVLVSGYVKYLRTVNAVNEDDALAEAKLEADLDNVDEVIIINEKEIK